MSGTLVEPLSASPLRSLIRTRFGSRVDRALVFLGRDGEDRVVHPMGREAGAGRPPTIAMVRRKAFGHVCWVSLIDHDASVDVPARPNGAQLHTHTVRKAVTWRTSDPVRVARRRLSAQDAVSWIAHDIARIDPDEHDDGDPDNATGPEYHVTEAGIAYRIRRAAPGIADCAPSVSATPSVWGPEQRELYRFYREVVGQGPRSLAALWLLHHPDQGREVLEWTVQNKSLLTEQAQWESSLVALLQGLGTEHRAFLGVNMAKILSELGVREAEQVLNQVRGGQTSDPHRALFEGER